MGDFGPIFPKKISNKYILSKISIKVKMINQVANKMEGLYKPNAPGRTVQVKTRHPGEGYRFSIGKRWEAWAGQPQRRYRTKSPAD